MKLMVLVSDRVRESACSDFMQIENGNIQSGPEIFRQ